MNAAKKAGITDAKIVEFEGMAFSLTTADLVLKDLVYSILPAEKARTFIETMKNNITRYSSIDSKLREDFVKAIDNMEITYNTQTGVMETESLPNKDKAEKIKKAFIKSQNRFNGFSPEDQKLLQDTAIQYVQNLESITKKLLKAILINF